jgi:hypothetical protein
MSGQAYQSSAKRAFVQAVVHLREKEYSLVANGRIAQLLAEDIQAMAMAPAGKAGKQARRNLWQQRLIRLVEHSWQHKQGPVLLTLADLSRMVGLDTVQISKLLAEARQKTSKPLATMGYYFDLGMKPRLYNCMNKDWTKQKLRTAVNIPKIVWGVACAIMSG